MIQEGCFPKGSAIAQEQRDTEAASYLVRKGKVQIESDDGVFNKTVTSGGYFGEDMLLADHHLLGAGGHPVMITSNYTVTVSSEEDCCVGLLKLEDVRTLLDTTILGLGKNPVISPMDASISMEDLTRHVM